MSAVIHSSTSSPAIVMLNGYAGCLKTTLSYLLAITSRSGHISTSLFGPIPSHRKSRSFNDLRDGRYRDLSRLMARYLGEGRNVIIDGTFSLRRWREPIYRAARLNSPSEVVAVFCHCCAPERLEKRFQFRRLHTNSPDAQANSIQAFYGSLKEFEPLHLDEIPPGMVRSIVSFDSCCGEVEITRTGPAAEAVAQLVRLFWRNGLLERSLFRPMKKWDSDGNQMIMFEGIGGSGKSTQKELASAWIRNKYGIVPATYDEFSDSALGRFIASSKGTSLRASPTSDPLGDNFIILNDFVRSFLFPKARRKISVLDSGILSRLAHLIAMRVDGFPEEAWRELIRTTDQVLQNLVVRRARTLSIYLDCPVDLAIKRLRNREEKIDDSDISFISDLSRAYRELISSRSDIVVVDGAGSRQQVHCRVTREISEWLQL